MCVAHLRVLERAVERSRLARAVAQRALLEVEEAPLVGEAVQPRGALPHEAAHAALLLEGLAALEALRLHGRSHQAVAGRGARC